MKIIKLNTNTMLVKSLQEIVKAEKYDAIVFMHADGEVIVKYSIFKQLLSSFHPDTMLSLKHHATQSAIILSSKLVTQQRCNHSSGFVGSSSVKVPCNACEGLQPDCKTCRGNGYTYQWTRNDCKYCGLVTANGKYTIYSGAWFDGNITKMELARSKALHIELY